MALFTGDPAPGRMSRVVSIRPHQGENPGELHVQVLLEFPGELGADAVEPLLEFTELLGEGLSLGRLSQRCSACGAQELDESL